jgi:hypothetical protein
MRERLAVEQLHRDVCGAVGELRALEHRRDAGMADAGGEARFLEKAAHDVVVGLVLRIQDLHRDLAVERLVIPGEHRAEPALAELAAERVLPDLTSGGKHGASNDAGRSPKSHDRDLVSSDGFALP